VSTCLFVYAVWYYTVYVAPIESRYPQPVANKIKRAIYWTNTEPDPKKALKGYQDAITEAIEIGMHPFSDEVIGLKLQLALMLEKFGLMADSIQVLEIIRADCRKWIELVNKDKPCADRTRILNIIVRISIKLGDLYGGDHVQDSENSEKNLEQAVETLLKEDHRRQVEGVKPDEGNWMGPDEMGATFEGEQLLYLPLSAY
jgi:hypothetical protein